jgi:sulfite reductase beta subunit-like hemoprotein
MSAVEFSSTTPGSGRLGFSSEQDLDQFLAMLARFESGDVSPDDWRAYRLVNGVYGQRQDDVYMIRCKIPQGVLTAPQLEALADVCEKWTHGKGHITTRQNIQFHFVKLDNVEAALTTLAAVGMTTREACGNAVRNVTGCPYAGVSSLELFDATPYAEAVTRHLLRGQWSASLPRKFKVAFGGCCGGDCIQAAINDLGFLQRVQDGRRGFRVTMGGGTATLRRNGVVVHEFLPVEEILEVAEAVVRTFHRIGNRKDKHKARLKWAIQKLGLDAVIAEYRKDREAITAEGGRPLVLGSQPAERLPVPPQELLAPPLPELEAFVARNVRPQKQAGFSSVAVRLILGDMLPAQMRGLATLTRQYGEGELRTTNEQNLVFRFVPTWQVSALHRELVALGLGAAGAKSIADVVACPGAASCKLAVTQSRGLATLLGDHFDNNPDIAALAPDMDIKISGCPNGCGQHHISGVGFQGAVRKVDGKAVPQYFLMLGGSVKAEGAVFNRQAAKIPARRIPEAMNRLLRVYATEKNDGEAPEDFFARVELPKIQALLKDLAEMDGTSATAEDFIDLGETRAFEVVLQEGECAA